MHKNGVISFKIIYVFIVLRMSQSALGLGGERRYSVPSNPMMHDPRGMHSEDLHAWSIYRYIQSLT